jgi:hypothetical protein
MFTTFDTYYNHSPPLCGSVFFPLAIPQFIILSHLASVKHVHKKIFYGEKSCLQKKLFYLQQFWQSLFVH